MESKRFKRKKFAPSHVGSKFPELLNDKPYIGIYNGYNISIIEKHAIHDVYHEGNFGKGSLSKSAPNREVLGDEPEILLQQQWENRLKWKTNCGDTKSYDNRVYTDSIRNLLDSAYSHCAGDSWKKWKENRVTGYDMKCDRWKMEENFLSPSGSKDTRNDDPLSSMVEEILLTRKVKEKQCSEENMKMALVVEDTQDRSTHEEINLSNIKVKLRESVPGVKEMLKLNLVEAFFLCFAIGRLKIVNEDGVTMSTTDLWKEFRLVEDNFISKYVAYHHYRSHGWTVRSGIKFGGDYLLYKIGPAYYHASYLVWLLDKKKNKRLTWSEFVTLNRLVETCNKDLLLCEIFESHTRIEDMDSPNVLKQFSVLEVVPKRWIPSQDRVTSVHKM